LRALRDNRVSKNPTALENIIPGSSHPDRLITASVSDDLGGIPAKTRQGEELRLYLGIIDILQCYKGT